MKVCFVSMPVATPHHPSLGLSLLAAALRQRGVDCDIKYFHLDFVAFLGFESFDLVSDDRLYEALIGDWLFASELSSSIEPVDFRYLTEVVFKRYRERFPLHRQMLLLEAKSMASEFIAYCTSAVAWESYDVVGFASSFQQHTASLALAKQIKKQCPEVVVAMGGANCEGDMGAQTLESYPFIDVIFSGEADTSFPDFVERLDQANGMRVEFLDSFGRRPIEALQSVDLNELPYPDYSDYYETLVALPEVASRYQPVPLFESARGCWWGAKNHCTFCGLNGSNIAFRSKEPARAFTEIEHLATQHGSDVLAVDNILDFKYFDSFLPLLRDSKKDYLIHYETKVNLRSEQIRLLAESGVRKIQPGIESLSAHILRLMRKGCTPIQNVQTLKLAAEAGIYVEWAVLFGFPGETADDYTTMAQVVRLIRHLQPPAAITRVRADRFSPYFKSPDMYGISIQAFDAYKYIHHVDEKAIERLAYHFSIDSPALREAESYVAPAAVEVQRWHAERLKFRLTVQFLFRSASIIDTRDPDEPKEFVVNDVAAQVLQKAAEITSIQSLRDQITSPSDELEDAINDLDMRGLIFREGRKILALPLRQPGLQRAPEIDDIRNPLNVTYMFAGGRGG